MDFRKKGSSRAQAFNPAENDEGDEEQNDGKAQPKPRQLMEKSGLSRFQGGMNMSQINTSTISVVGQTILYATV